MRRPESRRRTLLDFGNDYLATEFGRVGDALKSCKPDISDQGVRLILG